MNLVLCILHPTSSLVQRRIDLCCESRFPLDLSPSSSLYWTQIAQVFIRSLMFSAWDAMKDWVGTTTVPRSIRRSTRKARSFSYLIPLNPSHFIGKYLLEKEKIIKDNAWTLDDWIVSLYCTCINLLCILCAISWIVHWSKAFRWKGCTVNEISLSCPKTADFVSSNGSWTCNGIKISLTS